MARMKTLILDAAIAVVKVLEVDGTIEQILDTVDAISDIKIDAPVGRETR